jgi:uncharacterized cupredoxin-like copper-binding protein
VLLLGLSSGHKLGIALMAALFAGFSLAVALLVPKRWPQFPGRWLPVFLVVVVLLFVGMLSAVIFFGKESKSEAAPGGASSTGQTTSSPAQKISVTESEFKIQLPKTTFTAGTYMFAVSNAGKLPHDLTIMGAGGKEATPTIAPGGRNSVTAHLTKGTYDFYCSIPGHKAAGMDVKVTVS